jgi:hypothetical protein
MRGWFGLLGFLAVLLVAGIAGFIGYSIGVSANVATTSAGTVVYAPWAWGWGFPFFGLLFGILFLLLIAGLVRRIAWGGPDRRFGPPGSFGGGWDRHGWDGRSVPPFVEPMLQDWHRRAHGDAPTGGRAEGSAETGSP